MSVGTYSPPGRTRRNSPYRITCDNHKQKAYKQISPITGSTSPHDGDTKSTNADYMELCDTTSPSDNVRQRRSCHPS